MRFRDYAIRAAKHGYRFVGRKKFLPPECDMDRESANKKIHAMLSNPSACMISRFGTIELNCVNNYLCVKSSKKYIRRIIEYITDHTHTPWWNEDHFEAMSLNAGVFPPGVETSELFSQRYLEDIPLIDLLGSFQYYERFMPLSPNVQKVQLETLYPFFVSNPWTAALQGRRVLVVHPFDHTIREQYKRRRELFDSPEVLPDFELITLQAIQSAAGTKVPYKDWFEALRYMEKKISDINFDVCILGCGAYGLPLAAYVKRMGKQAIHLGGGAQLLFGIKGKRWVEQYAKVWNYRPGQSINIDYTLIFNDAWVYPAQFEKPQQANKVENACYW